MKKNRFLSSLVLLSALVFVSKVSAVWYESSGQAVVHQGNAQQARQIATQEAIKQALLFAGASISSIQRITNGLLEDDRLEVRSSGEVESIELIKEVYDGDILTVSIRADIFPQTTNCRASDYKKTLTTAWYPITHRQQAAVGQLFDFGEQLTSQLQIEFNQQAQGSTIANVQPYYLSLKNHGNETFELAKKTNSQFVLFGEIRDFSTTESSTNKFAFWQDNTLTRNLSLVLAVYDGNTGEEVFNQQKNMSAIWEFSAHDIIDPASSALWQSEFGNQVKTLLQTFSNDIDSTLRCLPAYGRVLFVNNDQININLGQKNGLKKGDRLTLFQMNQFFDTAGNIHQQYTLHKEPVVVTQVFNQTAIIASLSGAPLANIQANDFVARR